MAAPLDNAYAAPQLAVCNGPFATVLHAAPSMEARALWLDGRTIIWPGAGKEGQFKLYHSAEAALQAGVGKQVEGADGALSLPIAEGTVPQRFRFAGEGPLLSAAIDPKLLGSQLLLVREDANGIVLESTALQIAGALDDIYSSAENERALGVTLSRSGAVFKLWAPTARNVAVCIYDTGTSSASRVAPMRMDAKTGIWSASIPAPAKGRYYKYALDVFTPAAGLVRNLVTDPYSISLTSDSKRSYIGDLNDSSLKPAGWDASRAPLNVKAQPDMSIYELHVRDFSINDPAVSAANRGKYTAFKETSSAGMRHLIALARAGMTDVHLLPVYDIGSIPEHGCVSPAPAGAPDSEEQQALIARSMLKDCYNWGYDPYHYSAPEGSYSTDAADGARRIVEFREMVMALHKAGLRVGMDVVYNHTYRAGQEEASVLDRIVPGYYHRRNARGEIEQSTCCFNTATENRMMAKLMIDSAELWARHYKIDSFRFDLMGHQPREAMLALQERVNKAAGRHVNLIGEGWNFGEVANGARFAQASQLSLNGTGIGTFSDRGRDAVRGGGAGDSGEKMFSQQGYINGLFYDPNGHGAHSREELLNAADMVKVGLAGSVRSYRLRTHTGEVRELQAMVYGGGQPAGYASQPGEVVNYVENHDNQTLYDLNVLRLPRATSTADRARVQVLAAAINAFSQGVAYYHAGFDILRSKSLDRNSFESGDWFNRLDWSYQHNYFGTGLPPAADNGKDYALLKPLLADAQLKPSPVDIAFTRDAFRDLLRIRDSSTLFRLRTADDIGQRLHFLNTGPEQVPTVVAARIDGTGDAGARFKSLVYLINVGKEEAIIPADTGMAYRLHPVHSSKEAADKRAASARYDSATGRFTVPPRTAVVFVE
ncbi:alpha-1,6-glucosidase domain-containing protein [Massilia endophytica]|uniref:alpha-1,6-glucosidase domain-containing protein n=1 Tax=Massilia endophytica TaxID=2899220 RepID=UPI001E4D07F1|nr:alpha-1,6-glucosidase domain-containing protein [Massilia endophytica]UGQ45374.1 DUF3372 domain-containing protein [Massilia endophytica]